MYWSVIYFGEMELSRLLRLTLLTVFLLKFIFLHGGSVSGTERNLHCVNDYLTTINCSLSLSTPDGNSSYWLNITETSEKTTHVCKLKELTNGEYFCSVRIHNSEPGDLDMFDDTDNYNITLCHSAAQRCDVMIENYQVDVNIKPNAPCCLTLSHNSSHHLFSWRSTYENYSLYLMLPERLVYQLQFYQPGEGQNVTLHEINKYITNFSVASQKFAPGTKYAARVRSGPDQSIYWGEWSTWSSEVHWSTELVEEGLTSMYGLAKVFVPVCVLAPLLLLCTAYVKMWRKTAFIPTPAPYFHTLYSDCQGDFKSWVVAHEKTADVLQAEEILKFDTVVRCPDVPEEEHRTKYNHPFTDGSAYTNLIHPGCDECLLGFPYAVSTMIPPSEGSIGDLTYSSQLGSPDKEDPRYYSMTGGAPLYCNEYCTLSAFHQSHGDTAEKFGRASKDQA